MTKLRTGTCQQGKPLEFLYSKSFRFVQELALLLIRMRLGHSHCSFICHSSFLVTDIVFISPSHSLPLFLGHLLLQEADKYLHTQFSNKGMLSVCKCILSKDEWLVLVLLGILCDVLTPLPFALSFPQLFEIPTT